MAEHADPRLVLIAAAPGEAQALQRLFRDGPLYGWEARVAHSYAQARFVLQHDACCALLLDEALYRREGREGLDWLASQREAPVVFLVGAVPELLTEALAHGVDQWLPRAFAIDHPSLLVASLEQAIRTKDQSRRLRAAGEAVHLCRKQVSRLVNLLWETTPQDAPSHWFTQRHMMERLQEEVARAERQGAPFAVALGQVSPVETSPPLQPAQVGTWTAEQVQRHKRRADVAGRYGPHGFMLLLVQTPEPNAAIGCRRLQRTLEREATTAEGIASPIHVSFGIAGYSATNRSPKSLLSCAEKRLEDARSSQGDRLVFEN